MIRRGFSLAAIAAVTLASLAPVAADAHGWGHDRDWHDGGRYHGRHYDGDRGYHGGRGYYDGRGFYADRGYYGRSYYGRGYYGGPAYYYGHDRYYRCGRGSGGTIIGAIAGGLLGNEIARGHGRRGDGTAGAILGAGVGALAGGEIDRDC